MLISSLVMGQRDPQRVIRYLERFLFGKNDKTGIVTKMKLLGREATAQRIMLLQTVLLQQSSNKLQKETA